MAKKKKASNRGRGRGRGRGRADARASARSSAASDTTAGQPNSSRSRSNQSGSDVSPGERLRLVGSVLVAAMTQVGGYSESEAVRLWRAYATGHGAMALGRLQNSLMLPLYARDVHCAVQEATECLTEDAFEGMVGWAAVAMAAAGALGAWYGVVRLPPRAALFYVDALRRAGVPLRSEGRAYYGARAEAGEEDEHLLYPVETVRRRARGAITFAYQRALFGEHNAVVKMAAEVLLRDRPPAEVTIDAEAELETALAQVKSHCWFCLGVGDNFAACDKCNVVRYCCERHRDADWQHRDECERLGADERARERKLRDFVESKRRAGRLHVNDMDMTFLERASWIGRYFGITFPPMPNSLLWTLFTTPLKPTMLAKSDQALSGFEWGEEEED